jgi:hypothetical protein
MSRGSSGARLGLHDDLERQIVRPGELEVALGRDTGRP